MPFKQHPTDPDKMVWVPPQYNLMWPKREWVGLTFDDETECLAAGNAHGWKGVMKKTEEKLKEKNT